VYDSTDGFVLFLDPDTLGADTTLNETWMYRTSSWTLLGPTGAPLNGMLVDDPADHGVLDVGNDPTNLTWIFQAGQWTHLSFTVGPPAGSGYALVYDAYDHYVLFYGGGSGSGALGETWEFANESWSRLTPSTVPWPRTFAAMAFDSTDQYVVLFGGEIYRSGGYSDVNDTWEYRAGRWQELNASSGPPPIGPASSASALISDDPGNSSVLMWDPCSGVTDRCDGATAWTFSDGRWSTGTTNEEISSIASAGAPVFDPAVGGLVLLGTSSAGVPAGGVPTGSVWALVGGAWSQLAGQVIPAPGGLQPVYDSADRVELVDQGGIFWTLNGTRWSYNGTGPGAASCAIVDDAGDGYLFADCPRSSEQFLIDRDGSWTPLVQYAPTSPWPPDLEQPGFAYDAADQEVVLFGGYYADNFTAVNQTWVYRAGNWSELPTSLSPPSIGWWVPDTDLTYDSSDGELLLYLPWTSGNPRNETWTFRGGTWQELAARGAVEPGQTSLGDGVFVDDPPLGGVLFVGLINLTFSLTQSPGPWIPETWLFSAGAWTNLTAPSEPFPTSLWEAEAGYDPLNARVYVFTGSTQTNGGCGNPAQCVRGALWVWPEPLVPGALELDSFSAAPPRTDVGRAVQLSVTATGGNGSLSYAFSGLPPGCASEQSPTLTCVPTDAGVFILRVNVTDSSGVGVEGTLTLTVNLPPSVADFGAKPAVVSVGATTVVGGNISGGSAPFTFDFSGLPPGCSNLSRLPLECSPTSAGAYTIGMNATDSVGLSADASTVLTVTGSAPGPLAVLFFTVQPDSISLGGTVEFHFGLSGGRAPISPSYLDLPAGCTGAGLWDFNCTPTLPGTFEVYALARDSSGAEVFANATLRVLPVGGGSPGPPLGWAVTSFTALDAALAAVAAVTSVLAGVFGVLWHRRGAPPRPPGREDPGPGRR
jgi:hypothetical protein